MISNNKGFSLIEAVAAMAIVGINVLGFMNLQKNQSKNETRDKVQTVVADAGRAIQSALNNKNSCTEILQGKEVGDTFTDINANAKKIENELGTQVTVGGYEIILYNGQEYLEVTFNLSDTWVKNMGFKDVKKRYLISATKDTVNNKYLECVSDERAVATVEADIKVCESVGGVIGDNGDCNIIAPDGGIENPEKADCGEGAKYKFVFEDGKYKTTCTKCEPEKKFIRWSCQKGKDVGIKGVNWVNACYYRTGCKEQPGEKGAPSSFGVEFFEIGPTRASGGDTGIEKNCKKKRLPCTGEGVANNDPGLVAEGQSRLAIDYSRNTKDHADDILKNIRDREIDEAYSNFSYLKAAADAAAAAAMRSQNAANASGTSDAMKAAREAQKAAREAQANYDRGYVIFEIKNNNWDFADY